MTVKERIYAQIKNISGITVTDSDKEVRLGRSEPGKGNGLGMLGKPGGTRELLRISLEGARWPYTIRLPDDKVKASTEIGELVKSVESAINDARKRKLVIIAKVIGRSAGVLDEVPKSSWSLNGSKLGLSQTKIDEEIVPKLNSGVFAVFEKKLMLGRS